MNRVTACAASGQGWELAGQLDAPARTWGARWWLGATDAQPAVVLIRLVVGGVFVSEGVQKFVFPAALGPGRFASQTPLPAPTLLAYLDGGFEIGCGVLLVVGLLTRLACLPMIVNMVGAEVFTKFPLLGLPVAGAEKTTISCLCWS